MKKKSRKQEEIQKKTLNQKPSSDAMRSHAMVITIPYAQNTPLIVAGLSSTARYMLPSCTFRAIYRIWHRLFFLLGSFNPGMADLPSPPELPAIAS